MRRIKQLTISGLLLTFILPYVIFSQENLPTFGIGASIGSFVKNQTRKYTILSLINPTQIVAVITLGSYFRLEPTLHIQSYKSSNQDRTRYGLGVGIFSFFRLSETDALYLGTRPLYARSNYTIDDYRQRYTYTTEVVTLNLSAGYEYWIRPTFSIAAETQIGWNGYNYSERFLQRLKFDDRFVALQVMMRSYF